MIAPSIRPRTPHRRGAGSWLAPLVSRLYLGRPELSELIAIKYGSTRAAFTAAYNELLFRFKRVRGYRLVSANFEVTNRCNLSCTICPVNQGMKRPKTSMDLVSFERFLALNPELEFLLLFQWGEPLLVKQLPEMIALAAQKGVRTMITTNGTLLDETWSSRLLDAGLTRLTMSVDGDEETHRRIRGIELEPLRRNLQRLRRMRDERGAEMGIDVSMVINDATEAHWRGVQRSWAGIADRIQAIPQFMVRPRRHACREPSRGSLVVLADGSVTVCCADPEGEEVVGRADDQPLQEILNNERMRAFRRAHFRGEFPAICRDCGEFETRVVHPRFEW